MKILCPIYQLNEMDKLSAHVDGFLIGNDLFGTRLTHSFSVEEIKNAILKAKTLKKEIFLVANQMFTDDQLEQLKQFINDINLERVDGVIVGDLGALTIISKMGFKHKIIYNPETLLTNVYDVNFLHQEQILGAYLAKEITLEDIAYIANQKKLKLFMVGHGHLNMFYSKRQLIDNFMHFNEDENLYHNRQDMKIIEENRKDEAYPILEDRAGTHVFRSKVFSSLAYLDQLTNLIDYLVIDSIFKDDLYTLKVSKLYQEQAATPKEIKEIQDAYKEIWDEGFFYKKTIYKQKG